MSNQLRNLLSNRHREAADDIRALLSQIDEAARIIAARTNYNHTILQELWRIRESVAKGKKRTEDLELIQQLLEEAA